MRLQAGQSGPTLVPIESMKSRSLAVASAGRRARAPWSVSRAAVANWLWFVLIDRARRVCSLDETSLSEQVRSQIRLFLARMHSQLLVKYLPNGQ